LTEYLLTVEYDPLPISLINLKSFTVFFGIRDKAEVGAAIVVVSLVIIAKEKKTHRTSLEKSIQNKQDFYWSLKRTNRNEYLH
jgi:hypothetical protein